MVIHGKLLFQNAHCVHAGGTLEGHLKLTLDSTEQIQGKNFI